MAKTGDAAKQIMKLDQNVAEQLSVLVYLDGNEVDNADVAADVAQSMAGSLNLQFSSSADLKPMEYTDLRNGAGNTDASNPATPAAPTEITSVTAPEGYTAKAYYLNGKVGVVLTDSSNAAVTTGTVTINSETAELGTLGTYSAWIIDADTQPDSVTISYTAPTP